MYTNQLNLFFLTSPEYVSLLWLGTQLFRIYKDPPPSSLILIWQYKKSMPPRAAPVRAVRFEDDEEDERSSSDGEDDEMDVDEEDAFQPAEKVNPSSRHLRCVGDLVGMLGPFLL